MATRCNVKVTDGKDHAWYYRHWDGYPECTGKSLEHFMLWVWSGRVKTLADVAYWLIALGAHERADEGCGKFDESDNPATWTMGYYEPTDAGRDEKIRD